MDYSPPQENDDLSAGQRIYIFVNSEILLFRSQHPASWAKLKVQNSANTLTPLPTIHINSTFQPKGLVYRWNSTCIRDTDRM